MKPSLKLDESIASLQDLKALSMEIRDYGRWFAHDSIKKKVGAKTKRKVAEPELSAAAAAAVRTLKKPVTAAAIDQLVATLEDYAKTAPQFTIVLAAPPAAGFKKTIVAWCRDNVAPHVLVNFQFNSTILGGMVVRCGSHVYDWSFRRQILANREKFPEVLRRV